MREKIDIQNKNYVKRPKFWLKRFLIALCCLEILCVILFSVTFFISKYKENHISISKIKQEWAVYNYQNVYDLCKIYLKDKPYNNTVLAYFGYSAFYLALSQIDTQKMKSFLDESINNIRIALYSSNKSLTPQLQYMLGRAYFYKNSFSPPYYADLTIKYLLLAKENGYQANDIAEYLGLSYAALGMTMESISSFTEALLVRESDSLLLAIAEQYYKIKEYQVSEQYLFRIINNSENDDIIKKSEILLGNIYIDKEDYSQALKKFNNVLKKDPNSADAHYLIGVIYEKQGNLVMARGEWRQALKIQVNHAGALQKMSEN